MFTKGQVVCVWLVEGERANAQGMWNLGAILRVEGSGSETRYTVSVPSAHQDPPSYRERSAKYPSEVGKNEWSGMVLSDNPLVLLFARVASRTFLDSFKQGRVLKRRKVYTVSEGCLCSPEPPVLFRRIFP